MQLCYAADVVISELEMWTVTIITQCFKIQR